KRIADICRQYDVLLICDEVATGFGRTGRMFACEHEHICPDILALAKGMTGGYLPLAATLTTDRIYDGFAFDYKEQKAFFHGHTYTGNPLCAAAALANIELFERNNVIGGMDVKIKYLAKKLKMFYNLPFVGDVRQKGLMVGIELVKDPHTKEAFPWEEKIGVNVCQYARTKGILLRPLGNVIVLMPPLSITEAEMDWMLNIVGEGIENIKS
ncbi:MAG: aminotransferase class III-fold pyridoxal phosphate-dependent enzyme, partial [Candidatus Omnitrophica bacterium]|nr:aminotransferase class III-fold pyridoxal phosphate-dependent enzyme [Candidatus Omnitrophota bacterium]